MNRFYVQFAPDGKGRSTGWVADEDWHAHIAAHSEHGHVHVGLDKFKELAGRAHEHRFDLEQGIVRKTECVLAADKMTFKGDGNDRVTVTWSVGRPMNLRVNGIELTNNPHEDGLILTWDQQQKLRIEIDDYEFFGGIRLEAT